MFYLGVDLGTSSIKLVVMDEKGNIRATAGAEYGLSFPKPGWSEQDPADWVGGMKESFKKLSEKIDLKQVKGISFGGQMHGLVILDEEDKVLRPAILWNDGRTQKECDYLNKTVGREKISAYTANMALTGFTAPNILWVKENEPEIFKKICKIMLPKDYLAYVLTGVHCTDYSDASGMLLLDVKNKCWSKEMMELCDVRENQLAKLYESYEVVGTVKSDVAAELGLAEDVKVTAGAGDNAAGAIGTGTVKDGMTIVSLGTSGTVFTACDKFAVDDKNALHMFAHANGKYHLMGCMLSAASSNKWWMDEIIGTKDYAGEQKAIGTLGENHVYYLPYLMGERTPHNNPNARGSFVGMTMDTTRSDMTLAVLEGVTFALRDSLEIARSLGVKIDTIRATGGGAKSPLWRKLLANIMNVNVEIMNSEEGPGYGAAILAAVGCGEYASVEEATDKIVKVSDRLSPDPDLVKKYEVKYNVWRKIYPALKDAFEDIATK
ncbi:MAG: xylulokinase [Lachnospiraceae bacterium]|nr:xylulokinase [Lachnospiraceae bacterium]